MTRRIQWLGDPPRFVRTDEGGYPTGDYVDGGDARVLQGMLDERTPRPVLTQGGETTIEIGRSLPWNWSRDWNWEDKRRITTPRGATERQGGRGHIGGRRHPLTAAENGGIPPRSILVADTTDLVFVEWWKKHYPKIPYRRLSRDYHWWTDVIDVEEQDAELILLATIDEQGNPEFIDVTERQLAASSPQTA